MVGERCYLYDMLKNITFDLAIRQYYTDVSLFYVFEESHGEQFGWLRFLPHLQNTQLGGRNIVCDTDSRNSLLNTSIKNYHAERRKRLLLIVRSLCLYTMTLV